MGIKRIFRRIGKSGLVVASVAFPERTAAARALVRKPPKKSQEESAVPLTTTEYAKALVAGTPPGERDPAPVTGVATTATGSGAMVYGLVMLVADLMKWEVTPALAMEIAGVFAAVAGVWRVIRARK